MHIARPVVESDSKLGVLRWLHTVSSTSAVAADIKLR